MGHIRQRAKRAPVSTQLSAQEQERLKNIKGLM
jgi:hypothetical protein